MCRYEIIVMNSNNNTHVQSILNLSKNKSIQLHRWYNA